LKSSLPGFFETRKDEFPALHEFEKFYLKPGSRPTQSAMKLWHKEVRQQRQAAVASIIRSCLRMLLM
jgi:hypothetical protein